MILGIQQAMKNDGVEVSMSQLCRWFEVPRRTVYYKPTKTPPRVQDDLRSPSRR